MPGQPAFATGAGPLVEGTDGEVARPPAVGVTDAVVGDAVPVAVEVALGPTLVDALEVALEVAPEPAVVVGDGVEVVAPEPEVDGVVLGSTFWPGPEDPVTA